MGKPSFRRIDIIICTLLIAFIAGVYYRVLHAGFINLDDCEYVVDHLEVHTAPTLQAIVYAFQAVKVATWQPLVFISYMIDWQFWGLNPMGYHLTNLLQHTATTLLLYYVFRRMTGSVWKSGFVAAIFAIHPLHVESVAWVAERKDTLSALFWVLTMLAYLHYTQKPGIGRYVLLASTFVLGLLSKPMLITLPIVLLMLDYWPLKRIPISKKGKLQVGGRILEKIPLLALAVIVAVIASMTQRSAISSLDLVPLSERLQYVVSGYATYIFKMIWPANLSVLYPRPPHQTNMPIPALLGSIILLLAISIATAKSKSREYLKIGWLWYLVVLLPVSGLIQFGNQTMADRYTYIPMIGLSIMLAWGVPDILKSLKLPSRAPIYLGVITFVALTSLSACAWKQVGYWRDSVTLLDHSINITKDNWILESLLGSALAEEGRYDEAVEHYRVGTKIAPLFPDLWLGLGYVYVAEHKYDEAAKAFSEAERVSDPGNISPRLQAILQNGLNDTALKALASIVEFKPNPAGAHVDKGMGLVANGDSKGAVEEFGKAIRIDPHNARAYFGFGTIKHSAQDFDGAYADFSKAVEYNSKFAQAYLALAQIDFQRKNYKQAWKFIHLCAKNGGMVPEDAITALQSVMPEPKD